jgi:hypothetical protein
MVIGKNLTETMYVALCANPRIAALDDPRRKIAD